jgi:hypothetical protein
MSRTRLSLPIVAVIVAAAIVAVIAAAGSSAKKAPTIAANSALAVRQTSVGQTLTDSGGRTLYLFAADKPNLSTLSAAVAQPLAGVTDPRTRVTFPDLNAKGDELNQTNLILPEPCTFLHRSLPSCSIVRPTIDQLGGAVATIKSFTADRLFDGQSPKFFKTVHTIAREADAASRGSL